MILVTGATGFLGSELIKQLTDAGKSVRALKRSGSVIPPLLKDIMEIDWHEADVLDYFMLSPAFKDVKQVYHCAALVSFDSSDKKSLLKTNREGTAHIVNLSIENGIEKLLHVSSVAALGSEKEGKPVTEDTPWEFNGRQHAYSISKYESEMEVWRGIAEGLDAVIVNPSVIIGAAAGSKGSGQLINMVKRESRFYTAGSCGLVDVEDAARAMIMLMDSNITAERFIINAENRSFRSLFSDIALAFGKPAPSFEVKPWMLNLVWRAADLASSLTGKKYSLTKETAGSAFNKLQYSGKRFSERFPDFRYKAVKSTLEEIARRLSHH